MNRTAEELLATPTDGKPSRADRLAKVRAAEAARKQRDEDEALDAEIARGELVERLERETKGREGRDFAIVDLTGYGDGFIALKLENSLVFQQYHDSKHTPGDQQAFVIPCLVEPSREAFEALTLKRPMALDQAVVKLADLFGSKVKEDEKK